MKVSHDPGREVADRAGGHEWSLRVASVASCSPQRVRTYCTASLTRPPRSTRRGRRAPVPAGTPSRPRRRLIQAAHRPREAAAKPPGPVEGLCRVGTRAARARLIRIWPERGSFGGKKTDLQFSRATILPHVGFVNCTGCLDSLTILDQLFEYCRSVVRRLI